MTGFLVVTGLIFIAIGLRGLFKPVEAVADLYSLRTGGTDALSYLRASAGGVTVFSGLVMVAVLFCGWLVTPALVLVVAILGGLVFGRIVSLFVDGRPGPVIWFSLGAELFGLVQGVIWLWINYQHTTAAAA